MKISVFLPPIMKDIKLKKKCKVIINHKQHVLQLKFRNNQMAKSVLRIKMKILKVYQNTLKKIMKFT